MMWQLKKLALLAWMAHAAMSTLSTAAELNYTNTAQEFLSAPDLKEFDATIRLLTGCGVSGGGCCDSTTIYGNDYCIDQNNKVCSSNMCVDCGGRGERCCDTEFGKTCDSARQFCSNATNICTNCGYKDEPCCPPERGALRCRDNFHTTCDLSESNPTCKRCGGTREICCEGTKKCDSEFAVCNSTNNTCLPCGGPGQACCPNSQGSGACDAAINQRCVPDGTSFGICKKCGGEGQVCCGGTGNSQCNAANLMCNSSDECESCGKNNKPCCPGPDLSTAPGSGICRDTNINSCVSDGDEGGVCKYCGGNGQPCCSGDTCDSLFSACNSAGVCERCGKPGGLCCEGLLCSNSALYACNIAHSSGKPVCEYCGGRGELACIGFGNSPCDTEFSIVQNGKCQPCGDDGDRCCTGADPCKDSDSVCISGFCSPLHPTSMPTSSPVMDSITFPPTGGPWQEIPHSKMTFAKCEKSFLCRIVLVNGDDKIPVARSYDEGDWHQYAGKFATMEVSCGQSVCMIDLKVPDAEGAKYMLGVTGGYVLSQKEIAARFFESATFGMTHIDITELAEALASSGDSAFANWIQRQMDETTTPLSSLREFYRKRVNAIFEGSSYLGEVTQPCEQSTTYRRYAFSEKDFGKFVVISPVAGSSKKKIEIDGRLVTVVEGDVTATTANGTKFEGRFMVCDRPRQILGGDVRLRLPSGSCSRTFYGGVQGNPPVNLDGIAGVRIIDLDSTEAGPIDQELYQGQTQMITIKTQLTDQVCSDIASYGPGHVPTVFATYNGTWFVHSPRFKLSANNLSAPMVDGGGSIVARTTGSDEKFRTKCANAPRTFLNEDNCFLSKDPAACSTEYEIRSSLVCGSPNEVSNDLTLGGTQFNGAFDIETNWLETGTFSQAKAQVWTSVVLSAPDQLRQRMAWALSQIFVVKTSDTSGATATEQYVVYYDIFVRNAFGNYRDVLKEVSYSPIMANFLSFIDSKSTAFHLSEDDVHKHPDENYAREIMQLFTIGVVMLREDGTHVDGAGSTYTNDDITEYARVWTGFYRQRRRGNIEVGTWFNRIDPMQIGAGWRDRSPKMGLQGKYIGEGYPLCADLPLRHFLKAGAVYRLLGHTSYPELQKEQEMENWALNPYVERFQAEPSGALYSMLCNNSNGGSCQYSATITISSDLNCTNRECDVDTIRTVEVESGIFYEYVRPACLNLAFYENATKIKMQEGSPRTFMCADPRVEEATTLCCTSDQNGYRNVEYLAERVKLSTAQSRCTAASPMNMCSSTSNVRDCTISSCSGDPYYWMNSSCQLKVKIGSDRKVAIVHSSAQPESIKVTALVDEHTKTFFRVHWNDVAAVDELLRQCGESSSLCRVTADSSCLCNVTVSEFQAFNNTAPPTRIDVLALPFGAFQPTGNKVPVSDTADVWVNGSIPYTEETIFEVIDETGKKQLRKNMLSTVSLISTVAPQLEFPTPVHMMSLAEENERDAIYETEAALDHYFYHPNTAPFLAYRFAQRFGISNPTPQYVKAIARAFKEGQYTSVGGITFGSGKYGDLSSTIAALLLHSEARNILLEADSVHGSFREPLLKLLQLMRSLEFKTEKGAPITWFRDMHEKIRQMVFEAPDVFSFFHPDFEPEGIVGHSTMVSPEAGVINAPEIVGTLNGFQSLIKYGLLDCYGGFGYERLGRDGTWDYGCTRKVLGNYSGSTGHLTFLPDDTLSAAAVVDQLSLLMTSGRLNAASRAFIQRVYEDQKRTTGHTRATIRAQQLIVTTPEFHTSGRVLPDGTPRTVPSLSPPTGRPYKAVVILMLSGGCDSFNLIVPHTCAGSTLVTQYEQERGDLALTPLERSVRPVNMTGQPCDQFALHPELPTVEQLFRDGDLSFFFNIGVLDAPSSNTNYSHVTKTHLFAHNMMQDAAQRVDPFDMKVGTGVLGRLSDVMTLRGYHQSAVSVDFASVAVRGNLEASKPIVLNHNGVHPFHPRPTGEADIKWDAQVLNSGNDLWSSNIFGEAWSERFTRAMWQTDVLANTLKSVTLPKPPGYTLSKSFEIITKLALTREHRGTDRDVFYVQLSGFDHHYDMKVALSDKFYELDVSLNYLQQNLKTQNLWDKVALVTVSDFGRTLSPNSRLGSDHGWGGNYFVAGGGIKGGQGFCQYPDDLTSTSPWNVGYGRMLPSCAWESMWNPVVEWMLDGQLSDAERNHILINAKNSGSHLYPMSDLFE